MNEGSLRGRLRGNVGVLVLCSTVVLLSILMSADPQVARIFGWDVPPLCVFVNVLGTECLGCGMTRSFIFTAHGDLDAAWLLNRGGPPFWLLIASQIPYRALLVVRGALQLRDTKGKT